MSEPCQCCSHAKNRRPPCPHHHRQHPQQPIANHACQCQCMKRAQPRRKGKFILSFVADTPRDSGTPPDGWQLKLLDTPIHTLRRCQQLIDWVNSSPLSLCCLPRIKSITTSQLRPNRTVCCSTKEMDDNSKETKQTDEHDSQTVSSSVLSDEMAQNCAVSASSQTPSWNMFVPNQKQKLVAERGSYAGNEHVSFEASHLIGTKEVAAQVQQKDAASATNGSGSGRPSNQGSVNSNRSIGINISETDQQLDEDRPPLRRSVVSVGISVGDQIENDALQLEPRELVASKTSANKSTTMSGQSTFSDRKSGNHIESRNESIQSEHGDELLALTTVASQTSQPTEKKCKSYCKDFIRKHMFTDDDLKECVECCKANKSSLIDPS